MPWARRCDGEREEDRLPPGRASGLGHNGRDHVDELSEAGGLHPVGVLQRTDEQTPDNHCIGHGVVVLEQPGRVRPVFTSVIFPLSLKRSEYHTFHSSNEISML